MTRLLLMLLVLCGGAAQAQAETGGSIESTDGGFGPRSPLPP